MSKISCHLGGRKEGAKVVADRFQLDPQQMYRNLVEMAHEGITMVDPQDHLIYVNKQFARSLGYKTCELVGRSLFELATETTATRIEAEMKKRKRGLRSRYEVTLLHRDGSPKCFWLSASPMYGPAKEFIGSIGVYSDVTEKKAVEWKLEHKVSQINTLYRVYGHARMMKSLSNMFNGITQELVHAFPDSPNVFSKLAFDGRVYTFPKKSRRFYPVVKTPLILEGVRRGYIEVGYPIRMAEESNSFKEEQELVNNVAKILCKHLNAREILGRYREIVSKSFTAILIVRDQKIIFANPRFYRMFRCKEGQVVGYRVQNFFPHCTLSRCTDTKMKESQGKRANGEIFDLVLITQRINHNGRPAVLVRVNDTSALKKAQRKLDNFNAELKKTVKEKTLHLEEANKRLQSLNQMKDEFIAITSHELRSPLTSIRGYLSFLVEEESLTKISEPYRDYLVRAYSITDSLNYLINNILDVSRLDMGRFELQKQEVDLVKLISSILDSLSFQAGEAHLKLEFVNETGRKKLTLMVDPIRLSQVLRNVLDNAIKFTRKGRKITVTLSQNAQWVTVAVADQGVGIPKGKLDRVFDKFIQVRNTQTRYKGGVGLGLFIAKRIVVLHNGTIHADQNEDGGVTISVRLPRNS